MTDQPSYIAKPSVLKPAEDFYRLRQEGISFIEEMGTELWTDYNAHDPGITILEALCYGITELAYRTGWDIKDILTPDPAKKKAVSAADQPYPGQYFPSAREILTVNPVTPDDFRRLLISLKGVRNAWVTPTKCDFSLKKLRNFTGCKKQEQDSKKQVLDQENEEAFSDAVGDNKMPIVGGLYDVLLDLDGDLNIDDVKTVLCLHRNLCEDFCHIQEIGAEYIAVCTEIEVRPDVDIKSMQAQVLWEIEKYFSPSIPFYSLQELLDTEEKVEDIFNGYISISKFFTTDDLEIIRLKEKICNGCFIKTADLKAAVLKEKLYTSDLINLLMDIDGIIAIRHLRLFKCDKESKKIVPNNTPWVISLEHQHKAILWERDQCQCKKKINDGQIEQLSCLTFYKNGFPSQEKIECDEINHLFGGTERSKDEAAVDDDISIPKGTFRNLNEYFPVQYSLPTAYGIGPDGLPAQASDERRARAKQLQGYLMPFEQILANAFSQLEHVGDLFSLDQKKIDSYFVKEFDDEIISGIEEIFNSINEFSDSGSENGQDIDCMAQCPIKAKCEATEEQDCINFWHEDASQECNAAMSYARKTIDEIFQKYNQQERRNRFLDHLLARFGERFDDYRILNQAEDKTTLIKDLIEDKISFIKIQQKIGSDRAKSFDYTRNNGNYLECIELENEYLYIVTDSNVPELKRRVSLLLGCPDLHFFWKKRNKDGKIFFDLYLNDKNKKLLTKEFSWVSNYYFENREVDIDSIKNKLIEKSINILRLLSEYMDTPICIDIEAKFISRIDELLRWSICQRAIVVEHILLRPKSDIKEQDDPTSDQKDQYSFRLTFVIPGWHGLNNSDQTSRESFITMRNFTERIIRQETPAHLFVNILWVDSEPFTDFECAWCNWLAAQAEEKNVEEYRSAVLSKLCRLKNTYPSATLHDPTNDTSENKHPARLDQTNLGSSPDDMPKRLGEIVLENTDGRTTRLGEIVLDNSNLKGDLQ